MESKLLEKERSMSTESLCGSLKDYYSKLINKYYYLNKYHDINEVSEPVKLFIYSRYMVEAARNVSMNKYPCMKAVLDDDFNETFQPDTMLVNIAEYNALIEKKCAVVKSLVSEDMPEMLYVKKYNEIAYFITKATGDIVDYIAGFLETKSYDYSQLDHYNRIDGDVYRHHNHIYSLVDCLIIASFVTNNDMCLYNTDVKIDISKMLSEGMDMLKEYDSKFIQLDNEKKTAEIAYEVLADVITDFDNNTDAEQKSIVINIKR